ncbi:DUF3630 family protein [Shewanella eurypsychrophilus]|uniref:DUF3630 family protein n=1 Tax=Shewanella eurypsychrophilus TaxID=2593656 RepID=A0ABX6VIF9_9GAMM|nr:MULTISPECIES: DUF3630 family protein [Shewanella]QFU24723.1 DUF3630 family protein [Shewanella sp. YLB-09]QPG59915.1 DUF3630 family protein [Shewanella eurypsychrophilus]
MKLDSLTLDAGSNSLSIQADIDFEQFHVFAEPLVTATDCRVIERHDGADRHQWLLMFEGTHIQLNYEFYGDICWFSVERADDFEVLEYLASLLRKLL